MENKVEQWAIGGEVYEFVNEKDDDPFIEQPQVTLNNIILNIKSRDICSKCDRVKDKSTFMEYCTDGSMGFNCPYNQD